MKKIKIFLSALAFISAIAGAYATVAVVNDAPVRAFIGGVCQQIECTTVRRSAAGFCPFQTDDGNYYTPSDINCTRFPITVLTWDRINQ